MQALGLIETRGLLVAVESADAMLKAADVTLLEKTYVGGGLVSIVVTGEVAAVKAAVDAGAAAIRQINGSLLISQHVIPRPHEELENVMVSAIKLEDVKIQMAETHLEEQKIALEEPQKNEVESIVDELNKKEVDKMVLNNGVDYAIEAIGRLKVVKLRNLAREYPKFGIVGRLISKADKKMLVAEFREYYIKN